MGRTKTNKKRITIHHYKIKEKKFCPPTTTNAHKFDEGQIYPSARRVPSHSAILSFFFWLADGVTQPSCLIYATIVHIYPTIVHIYPPVIRILPPNRCI